jgi:hypothetical protein
VDIWVSKKPLIKLRVIFIGLESMVTSLDFVALVTFAKKTIQKGKVPKVPLEMMPLIDTPFKRVAVDLVGPIYPPSEQEHRYILTLVDYTTRYPDAVPLK